MSVSLHFPSLRADGFHRRVVAGVLFVLTPILVTLPTPARASDESPQKNATAPPEADRQAILAMAGEFEVLFNFKETVSLQPDYKLKSEYQEEATELVVVAEDSGSRIALQHLLLTGEGDRVIKHWKQVWTWEDDRMVIYRGKNQWKIVDIPAERTEGHWTQLVTQVDDSPRYESFGQWIHRDGISFWQSRPTPRPLPRREYTTREDYQVLLGINRHTITPHGWAHEQDNLKQVLGEARKENRFLVREAGLNYYDHAGDDIDFSAARNYWAETREFWQKVSNVWENLVSERESFELIGEVDGTPMYKRLFELAKDPKARETMDEAAIRAEIGEYLAD